MGIIITQSGNIFLLIMNMDNELFNIFCRNGFIGIHATGFKDFMLREEINRAITDAGFEAPSEGEYL